MIKSNDTLCQSYYQCFHVSHEMAYLICMYSPMDAIMSCCHLRVEAGLLRSMKKNGKHRGKVSSSSDEMKKLSAKQEKALEKKEKVS